MSGNTFAYGSAESKIESVVYTVDAHKVYTFYFSPTQGLVDLEAMLLADDYVMISTDTPTGVIDLLSANNSLLYKQANVSPDNQTNVAKAELTLQLTSVTTAKMNLDVAMKSGETLRAEFNGTCFKQKANEEAAYDVTLTKRIFAYYMGEVKNKKPVCEFRLAVTNADKWSGTGQDISITSEGYVLALTFYATPGADWKKIVTGSYAESNLKDNLTFDGERSGVLYRDSQGKTKQFKLLDPIKIERDAEDLVTIQASFLDEKYREHTLIYKAELIISNGLLNVKLPQMERDVIVDGVYAEGVYNGDVAKNGTGLSEITIYDHNANNNKSDGYIVRLAVFAEKFTNPKVERRLIPGTYKVVENNIIKQFTWLRPTEQEIMGMVFPVGTYALHDNGTQNGEYSYGYSGTIVIRDAGTKGRYTVECSLQSLAGYSVKASYTGEIFLTDQSSDTEDDGTSNLKDDYVLDMNYLPRGECFKRDYIWVRGLGTVSVETACEYSKREYGYQFIQFGTEDGTWEITEEYPKGKGKLIEGDILGIDLIVTKGTEHQITPGVYPITLNRYPAYFQPGVCVCGYNRMFGTSMMRVVSAIGNGYPDNHRDPNYMVTNGWLNVPRLGKYASIYTGKITITKAAGADNMFTFAVEGKDVLKHTITGTWTGPIFVGGTDTPAVQSDVTTKPAVRATYPSYRELQAQSGRSLISENRYIYR